MIKALALSLFVTFLFSCAHISNKEKPITASKLYFGVVKIEPVNDTLKSICKYHLIGDSSIVHSPSRGNTADNPVELDIIDTTGKYKIGDTLSISLKINSTDEGY